jgi:hypothetical protein
MINFFRKIRRKLADDNKPLKYMRYAIGEILLVVIGILIALQINTFNQNRINKKSEQYYLGQMSQDLIADSLFLHQEKVNFEKSLPTIQNFLTELHKDNNRERFNVAFRNYINDVLLPLSFVANTATYDEMKSSAKLGIISDKVLRIGIIKLYNHLEQTQNIYASNYDFMHTIDVELISELGLAKYQNKQYAMFKPYASEEELYALKSIKFKLESNAANWHWSIIDLLQAINAQLVEIRDVLAKIQSSIKQDG